MALKNYNENQDKVDNFEFWDHLYKNNDAKWDIGAPAPVFKEWIETLIPKKSICVLGAGNGWDAICFAEAGHNVTAVDFSIEAVKNMEQMAKMKKVSIDIIYENIFNIEDLYSNSFDFVVEYTCFCAINPNNRCSYVDLVYNILKPSGKFVALLFPLFDGATNEGPPFPVNYNKTKKLFGKYFRIILEESPKLSIPSRIGKEIFTIMERNGN